MTELWVDTPEPKRQAYRELVCICALSAGFVVGCGLYLIWRFCA